MFFLVTLSHFMAFIFIILAHANGGEVPHLGLYAIAVLFIVIGFAPILYYSWRSIHNEH